MKRLVLACAALMSSLSAHAEIVTIEYEGVINFIREYAPGTPYKGVASSAVVPGGIAIGDTFHGSFTFDTGSLFDPGLSPASSAYYAAPTGPASASASLLVFDKSGTRHQAGSDGASIVVRDSDSGDGLLLNGAARPTSDLRLRFHDTTGNALSGLGIPDQIDLGAWNYGELNIFWGDPYSGKYVYADGLLTSVVKVSPVPEPASYALLFAGLAIVAGGAARKRNRILPLKDAKHGQD